MDTHPRTPARSANGGGHPASVRTDGVRIRPRADGAPAPAAHLSGIVQALSIRYSNLVHEMKSRGENVILLLYRKERLAGAPELMELPAGHPRPAEQQLAERNPSTKG